MKPRLSFRSGDLTLEGLLANPGWRRAGCRGLSSASDVRRFDAQQRRPSDPRGDVASGYATLRFRTFAGVGGSEGEHDGGPRRSR